MNRKQTTSVPQPLPHQRKCLSKIGECLRKGISPILFVMASGLGKTYTAAFAYQMFRRMAKRARVLFLAHHVDLLDQAQVTFARLFGSTMSYGPFNKDKKTPAADAVFSTLQSMHAELFERPRSRPQSFFRPRDFDFVIVDESHHGYAPTYHEVIEYFRPRHRLGMTATPDRSDMKDIREIFGDEIFSLDLEGAMAAGLLATVQYLILADEIVDKGKLRVPPHLIRVNQLNRLFFARKRDREIARSILDKISTVTQPQVIIFCPSINHAERFVKLLPGSVTIHSRVPKRERQERLALYRQGILRIAVTVDQFNEGVDIPEANVLVFLRSTQSRTVFFQQLGRGLRQVPGKGQVLVLDFVASCERLQLVDQLRQKVQAATTTKTRRRRGKPRSQILVNWGEVIFEERARQVLDMLHQIKFGLSDESMLEYLHKFHQLHGRAPTGEDLTTANGMPSAESYRRKFGGLTAALRKAGIPELALSRRQREQREQPPAFSDAELLNKLREFYCRTGRAPKAKRDLRAKLGMPTGDTYRKRFGSLRTAFQLARIPKRALSPMQRITAGLGVRPQSAVAQVRAFYRRKRRAPTLLDFTKKNKLPSGTTIRTLFRGGILEVLHRARLPTKSLGKQQRLAMKKWLQKTRRKKRR